MDDDGGVDSWAIGEYSEVISMLEAAAAAAAAPRVMGGALLSPHPHPLSLRPCSDLLSHSLCSLRVCARVHNVKVFFQLLRLRYGLINPKP